MESNNEIKRQAVVIIHGMGEQRPMDTLRSFVYNIKNYLEKNDKSEKRTIIRSKPDGISEIFETRRLSLSASGKRPITDFYEFYWAHNMRDNKFKNILSWIGKLLFSKQKNIPERLLPIWKAIWCFLVISVVIACLVFFLVGADKLKTYWTSIAFVPFVFGLILVYIESTILNSVGDAGRYFTPTPVNIGERSKIRQQGIAFLNKIHEQTEGQKYQRVIIVAHSLGGVIAYDLLRQLWTEYNDTFNKVSEIDQSAIKEIAKYSNDKNEHGDFSLFQDIQFQCWSQQKVIGCKWLISDFITLGAPLCHADYLIPNALSVEELKHQREFPACPPVSDDLTQEIHYDSKFFETDKGKRTIKILDHAALFAVTRWTNIYYSSDFIGGPMQRLFGRGVKDVEVPRKSSKLFPGGHTHYWDKNNEEALAKIADALHLQRKAEPKPKLVTEE